jgi:hypothetical protein
MEAVCFSETLVSADGVATQKTSINMVTTGTGTALLRFSVKLLVYGID